LKKLLPAGRLARWSGGTPSSVVGSTGDEITFYTAFIIGVIGVIVFAVWGPYLKPE